MHIDILLKLLFTLVNFFSNSPLQSCTHDVTTVLLTFASFQNKNKYKNT